MPIFRLNVNSDLLFLASIVLIISASVSPVLSQETTSLERPVQPGDTFEIPLNVNSSFHKWQVENYDVRTLSLQSRIPADTIGQYRFVFEALKSGVTEVEFIKLLDTAMSSEEIDQNVVSVEVDESTPESAGQDTDQPAEQPTEETTQDPGTEETEPEVEPEQTEAPESDQPETPGEVDATAWNEVQELIQTGHFEKARNMINDEADRAAGRAHQLWREKKAETYLKQDNYEEAINVWQKLIDDFSQGPKAKWLMSIAETHIKNDAPDEAELSLLEIRHRHRDSKEWAKAMKLLAQLAKNRDEINRAKEILEEAQSELSDRRNPDILMTLAEIYDKFPSARNYYKAVKFYRKAARRFDQSDTRSQKAKDRAEYLTKNFLNFGTQ